MSIIEQRQPMQEGLPQVVREPAGRRSAIYRFEPLMQRVRVQALRRGVFPTG